MANDFMGYILAALTGTGQGVDQLQQRDRQRALDDEARKRAAAEQEMNTATMALRGIFQGKAPTNSTALPTSVPTAPGEVPRLQSPGERYRQVSPNLYLDSDQTPEAQQSRRDAQRQAAETQQARLRADAEQARETVRQKAAYNTLRAVYPKHPLAALPFDSATDYRAGMEQAQRESSEDRRDARQQQSLNAIAARASGASGGIVADMKRLNGVSKLSGDYENNPAIKNAYQTANAISGLKAALSGDSPMDDLSVIYQTVKLFDPGSVVKEGEIRLTQSANSLPGQARLLLANWQKGRKLTPQMRNQIAQLIAAKERETMRQVTPIQARFGATARNFGLAADSAQIAPSPFDGVAGGASALTPESFMRNKRGGQ